ncbi:hypothetical protein [Microbacterium sp. K24]|uniref:hypothetical protein n=1 Tax=Microbacterium sp. K24 TaxID=2305446 RepID=UPI00109C340A|nr:hypothetical protein [Microbacterium sp. K24]
MEAESQIHPAAPPSPEQRTSVPAGKVWSLLPAHVFLTGLITWLVIGEWTVIAGAYTEGLQVVGFAVVSAVLTILVFLLGLPLRIAPPLRRWWIRHAAWMLGLFILGAAGVVLSYFVGHAGPVYYDEVADWPLTDGFEPDAGVFGSSLVVLAFATMHLRLPQRRRRTRLR